MYIVKQYNLLTKYEYIFAYYFKTREEAIKFIYSKMNKEDIDKTIAAQKRNLYTINEFATKNKAFEIIELKEYTEEQKEKQ